MYRKDKIKLTVIFIVTTFVSFIAQWDVSVIKSDILTVISIILGFYMAALSVLFGSKLANEMSKRVDSKNKVNSELHTALSYFRCGMQLGVATIILVILVTLSNGTKCIFITRVRSFSSYIGIGIFAIDLYVMMRIFKFIKNAVEKEVQISERRE